jgi:hypothetical protein
MDKVKSKLVTMTIHYTTTKTRLRSSSITRSIERSRAR